MNSSDKYRECAYRIYIDMVTEYDEEAVNPNKEREKTLDRWTTILRMYFDPDAYTVSAGTPTGG